MIPELEATEVGLIQRIHALRSMWSNAKLPTTTLAAVAANTSSVRIPVGTVLGRDGDPPGMAYMIIEGEITASREGKVIATFSARGSVGMLPALSREARGLDYVATRETVALALRADDLLEIFEDHFELLHAALRGLAADAISLRQALGSDAGFDRHLKASAVCPAHPLDLVERLLHLRQTLGFHESHIDALAEFAVAAIEVRYSRGQHLWSVGDRSQSLLVMICGVLDARTAEGQRFQFGPGDLVGGLDLLAGIPRWFDVEVEQDVVALSLDGELLVDLLEDQPELGFDFLRLLATMLMSLRERLAERNGAP